MAKPPIKIRKAGRPALDDTPAPKAEGLIEPSPDEKKNGWTAETLTKYLRERDSEGQAFAQQQAELAPKPVRVQSTQNFDPHRW